MGTFVTKSKSFKNKKNKIPVKRLKFEKEKQELENQAMLGSIS